MLSFGQSLQLYIRQPCSAELCYAQPTACPQPMPHFASTRPDREQQRQNFSTTFLNTASEPVSLNWLSANGTVGSVVTTIAPGASHRVRAITGDAFTAVSDADGRLLMQWMAGPAVIRECTCADTPLLLCPPRSPAVHNRTERPTYEPAGFVNVSPGAVDVYLYARGCETLLTSAGPIERGGQLHLAAWASQRYRVRDHLQQRLLLEHVVGEVLVRSCERASSTAQALRELKEQLQVLTMQQARTNHVLNALDQRVDAALAQMRALAAVVPPDAVDTPTNGAKSESSAWSTVTSGQPPEADADANGRRDAPPHVHVQRVEVDPASGHRVPDS